MKRLALLILVLAGCSAPANTRTAERPKNVILLIGDGMGFPQVTLTRMLHGPLTLDEFEITGFVKTGSLDGWVTDSAAAATSMACGIKTYNGAIGVDGEKKPVKTILEEARDRGLMTGLVTTSKITHATPAAFGAHVTYRGMEKDIAKQYMTAGIDVLIGGGKSFFTGEMIEDLKEKGTLLGLFSDSHFPYLLDRTEMHTFLPDMTRSALGHFSKNNRNFFLMVEGARIDHACHASDAAGSVTETLEFDQTVKVALDFAIQDGHTLVIVTADHGTGAMAVTEKVQGRKHLWKKVTASAEAMSRMVRDGHALRDVLREHAGIEDVTDEEEALFHSTSGPYDPASAIGEIVSKRLGVSFIPFRYRITKPNRLHGHDGAMVPVYAYGPGAERFRGTIDNTDIAKGIRERTGW